MIFDRGVSTRHRLFGDVRERPDIGPERKASDERDAYTDPQYDGTRGSSRQRGSVPRRRGHEPDEQHEEHVHHGRQNQGNRSQEKRDSPSLFADDERGCGEQHEGHVAGEHWIGKGPFG